MVAISRRPPIKPLCWMPYTYTLMHVNYFSGKLGAGERRGERPKADPEMVRAPTWVSTGQAASDQSHGAGLPGAVGMQASQQSCSSHPVS